STSTQFEVTPFPSEDGTGSVGVPDQPSQSQGQIRALVREVLSCQNETTRTADHSPLLGHSLEILGLFCYAERGSVFRNGNWAFTGAWDCKAMPWKKGQSGNPLGRLPGEKQFADQLRIVLAEPVDKNDPKSVRKMRRIAEKLVDCALNGE